MLRLSRILFISIVALVMSSCSTNLNKSQPSSSIQFNVTSSMQADVDVDMGRILKGSAEESVLFGIFRLKSSRQYLDGVTYGGGEDTGGIFGDGTVSRAKAAAAYNALRKEGDVDVLVAPRYVIQQKSVLGMYKRVVVNVTGYAGKIKRIRNSNK